MGLIAWIKRATGLSKDKKLQCAECHTSFFFEEGEQRFFNERGLSEPKRCPRCRQQTRRHRGSREGHRDRGARTRP